jgi:prepilin-type N-terminal cleavage/methylation domain-containing protein
MPKQQGLDSEAGFTLIEIMVVLVLLGTLVGLILLGISPFEDAAKDAVEGADADTCRTAEAVADTTTSGDSASDYAAECP